MKQAIAAAALGSALLALSACGGKQAASPAASAPATTVAVTPPAATTGTTAAPAPVRRHKPHKPAVSRARRTSSSTSASSGGDNSLQTFGTAAAGADRAALEGVVRRYLTAAAGADAATECQLLASDVTRQLEAIASHAPPLKGKPCAAMLTAMQSAGMPKDLAAAYRHATVVQVRVAHGGAVALLRLPGQGRQFLPLKQEGGGWKVRALAPSPMP